MRIERLLRHYGFGLLMGGADVVPGVSGGTVALIVGIYRRLIDSISRAVAIVPLLARRRPGDARTSIASVEWALVLPLAAGILTAIAVGSVVIPELMEDHPVLMRATFFGLIAASIALPWGQIRVRSGRTIAVLLLAAIGAFLFSGLPDTSVTEPIYPVVFGAAAIAICAMILPGVSGAFLLVILGMYEPTLEAVRDRDLVYVAVFGFGAIVGLALFSSVLRWLLERVHDVTMAALVGLMAGSLRALWPFLEEDRGLRLPADGDPVISAAVLAFGGFVFVLGLTRIGGGAETADETATSDARRSGRRHER